MFLWFSAPLRTSNLGTREHQRRLAFKLKHSELGSGPYSPANPEVQRRLAARWFPTGPENESETRGLTNPDAFITTLKPRAKAI